MEKLPINSSSNFLPGVILPIFTAEKKRIGVYLATLLYLRPDGTVFLGLFQVTSITQAAISIAV